MAKAVKLNLSIIDQKQYLLTWDLSGDSEEKNFVIQRSESPVSEFKDIGIVADTVTQYLDTAPITKRKYVPFYYRIKNPDNTYSDIINMPGHLDRYMVQYARMLSRVLKRDIGIKSYYFRKLLIGKRCDCWDSVLRKSVNSECPNCHGSGIINGYSDPAEIYIAYPADTPNKINTGIVTYSILTPNVWTANYPFIFPNDIIIRGSDKEVFKVGNRVDRIGRRACVVRQMFQVQAIERGSIEFDLIGKLP